MGNKFTQKAQNSLNKALCFARDMGHTYIGSEHILFGLSDEADSIAARILVCRGATPEKIKNCITELAGRGSKSSVTPYDMTPRARKIIENSAMQAESTSCSFIGTEHLLLSLLDEKECIAQRILSTIGVKSYELSLDLSGVGSSMSEKKDKEGKASAEEKPRIKGAPALSLYGKELTEAARLCKLDPIIGREKETERVIQILSRRTKNNPCLIGEPGVGKTAVVEGLAERIISGDIPPSLFGKRIVTLDISSMIAGSKYRGEFEERMKKVMDDVRKNPDIILFIDEIHMIIGAGAAEGAVDAANIIKPALARGEIQVIGATTISEYRLRIEKDAALERRFQSVSIDEPDTDEAVRILTGLRPKYEEHHGLKISNEAISAAVTLSKRYIPDRYLPDKAIDLLDEAASKLKITASAQYKKSSPSNTEEGLKLTAKRKENAIMASDLSLAAEIHKDELALKKQLEISDTFSIGEQSPPHLSSDIPTVLASDIASIVTEWTGIPVSSLCEYENQRLIDLEERLSLHIIGQDSAIKAVGDAIRRGRIGFKNPRRPIGTFIFYGPTGVGKTALAKALAEEIFGGEDSLIRFDMSEYMESHSISKLIGSPPGYVGYEEGGRLTEKVRRRPYSVVLFDEIEKAHHDIFNLLLQILDEGTLCDSSGRQIDFKNTVVILTACDSSEKQGSSVLGFSDRPEGSTAPSPSSLKNIFSAELLSRIDEILMFRQLCESDLLRIADNMLSEVRKRALDIGISLDFAPAVSHFLADEAKRENSGARPLRRAIVHHIENSISNSLLGGCLSAGDHILCSVDDGEVRLLRTDSVVKV